MSSVSRALAIVGSLAAIGAVFGIAYARQPRTTTPVHLSAPEMTVQQVASDPSQLRVCADPNNLPFSNTLGEGFENAIAELAARDLGKTLTYYWLPQRRGFVRNSLNAGVCDVIIGVAAGYSRVRTTRPYYRSSYVFVSRHTDRAAIVSFDDPALRRMTIGVQITGDDYQNPPPAEALAARSLLANMRGYTVYGDYSETAPQRRIIDDVGEGRLDAAVVWGPVGGYFARQVHTRLDVSPVSPQNDPGAGVMAFNIAMGVRRDDVAMQEQLDRFLVSGQRDISAILRRFGVPITRPEPRRQKSGEAS